MSGIVAVLDRSGGVSDAEVEALLATIDHRGPDGSDHVAAGSVGLGHQHFCTTPEERGERQPVSKDGVWVAFDGRLDNRAEVCGDPPDGDRSDRSDAEVVLDRYLDCGEAFLDAVVGAFAVVVWDSASERLVCARDKTGIRHLYYGECGDRYVVSSEVGTIVGHPAFDGGVDELAAVEFLAGHRPTDTQATFYRGVKRVLPGSYVAFEGSGPRVEQYWTPDCERRHLSEAEAVAEFERVFEQAVADRLRAPGTPAVTMSGGLDSTSIACVAQTALDERDAGTIASYVAYPDDVGDRSAWAAERDRAAAVCRAYGIPLNETPIAVEATSVGADVYAPFLRNGPCINSLSPVTETLYAAAAGDDHRVAFTGIGGELAVGSRLHYADLLRERRPVAALVNLVSDPEPTRSLLVESVVAPLWFPALSPIDTRRLDADAPTPDWVNPAAAESAATPAVRDDLGLDLDSLSYRSSYQLLFNYVRDVTRDVETQAALRNGVELRYPFYDSRLVEIVFSLAEDVRYRRGEDKRLLRRAMDGVLPERVRTNTRRVTFDATVDALLRRNEGVFRRAVADSRLADRGLVDGEAMEAMLDGYFAGEHDRTNAAWTAITTELWLDQYG